MNMTKCPYCKKKIVWAEDYIDIDEDGNVYHLRCLLEERNLKNDYTKGKKKT